MFFNEIAHSYDDWYKTRLGAFADEVETELAFKLFSPYKGMRVLDVGCGTGNFSVKLAEKGCVVTGIDISDQMLKKAAAKAAKAGLNIDFHNMDIYNLAFGNNTFDGVFSMATFEFIQKPKKAFDEMMRVLKPGGKLLIGTINRDSQWGKFYMQQAKKGDSIFRFAHFKNMDELKSLDTNNLVKSGQCLFIPPNAEEEKINRAEEKRLSKFEKGGFICALWVKPEE